jgi:hypothetical protein
MAILTHKIAKSLAGCPLALPLAALRSIFRVTSSLLDICFA